MGSNWIDAKLGDYIDSCLGKMLDKNKNKGEFYPYLGNSNVRWGAFDLDELAQMKFEEHEHVRYGIKAGDLIVCEGGEPGRCAIWEDDLPNMKIQKALHRVRTLDGLDSEFLYYWFLFAGKNKLLDAYFTGTTIKHLTGKALKEIPIKIPPLKHQKQVAVLLRSFDKKIKINRQTNQTLEQMAQTLFKSWFVDFDPVIDNALDAGNPIPEGFETRVERRKAVRESTDFKPLPDDVRQLFPSEFEESELGWVPKGWSVTSVSEISDILNGFAFKSKDYVTSGNFVLRTKNFSENQVKKAHDDVFLPDKFLDSHSKYLCKPLDYHLVMVGASVGKCALIFEHHLPALRNQNMWCFRAKDKSIASQSFIKYMLDNLVLKNQGLASGSAREFFRKGDFGNQQVVIGSSDIQRQFEMNVLPSIEKMSLIASEADVLTKLRDTLLPKLISGELRLDSPEVEQAKALVE